MPTKYRRFEIDEHEINVDIVAGLHPANDHSMTFSAGNLWCSRASHRIIRSSWFEKRCFAVVLLAVGFVSLLVAGNTKTLKFFGTMSREIEASLTLTTNWVASHCSEPGTNCNKTQCCSWNGMQCYQKDDKWASCKTSCFPGPDPTDMNSHPWNCKKLGTRTPGKTTKSVKIQVGEWVALKCSKFGANCKNSKCCASAGMQCYEKNMNFASCKPSCVPGPDPTDKDPRPWSCNKLGSRTPGKPEMPSSEKGLPKWVASHCSKPGANCLDSKCCISPGMQCSQKNQHWASCKSSCNPGPDPTDKTPDPWSCKKLGGRTPGKDTTLSAMKAADWVISSCSKHGEDCRTSKCCASAGMQCYEKEAGWATCRPSCTPGPQPTDINPHPWSCKEFGSRTPGIARETSSAWVPKWVTEHCSQPGTDCSKSKCCASPGLQCHEKFEGWALCRASCTPGPDPTDMDPIHWSCKKLGGRTAGTAPNFPLGPKLPKWALSNCSRPGADCKHTKCCTWEGLQCYEKNSKYATCKPACNPGPDTMDTDRQPWSCRTLGSRMPGKIPKRSEFWSKKLPQWVSEYCSASSDNCMEKRCCASEGLQCYAKHESWASCRASCTPGPDPTDANSDPWSCEKLGSRTPGKIPEPNLLYMKPASWVASLCAKDGENCAETKCCRGAGMQCYAKTESWAICKASCIPGVPDPNDINPDPWSCKMLGGRTPGKSPEPSHDAKLPKWMDSKCASVGHDCTSTKCCKDKGLQCYVKNQNWALCQAKCTPGIDPTDHAGGDWSCKELGYRTPKPWGSPTLFCFVVMRATGYEPDLMKLQYKLGSGIFACEEYALLSSSPLSFDSTVKVLTFPPAAIGISTDGTAGNTKLFLNVWNAIRADGTCLKHDWTVKVDPDAVMIPDRLRQHLLPHVDQNVYIVNCDKPGIVPMMFGALEAFSKKAMETFFAGMMKCEQELPWPKWGEDKFMGHCLSRLGVGAVNDFSIYTDGVCKGMNCEDPVAAAFHPLKKLQDWLFCYNTANSKR